MPIIELSTRYCLLSRETSFVAIERRETPVTGDIQLRRVPIALTAGWGGMDERATGILNRPSAMPITLGGFVQGYDGVSEAMLRYATPPPRTAPMERQSSVPSASQRGLDRVRRRRGGASPPDLEAGELRLSSELGLHAEMVALVSLQRADGSWELSDDLARIVGHDLDSLRHAIRGSAGAATEVRAAWATARALVWLDEHMRRFEDEWGAAAGKARRWLDAVSARPPDGGPWMEAAARMRSTASR